MSIEEQIAALEARIQQAILVASGCTERAEQAASRAEEAAARAELATVNAETAASVSLVASASANESMTISSEAAVEAAEIMEEIEQIVEDEEDAGEILPIEGGSGEARESEEPADLLDGEREESDGAEHAVQPIVIEIKESTPREQHLFKPNRTRFSRGRKA